MKNSPWLLQRALQTAALSFLALLVWQWSGKPVPLEQDAPVSAATAVEPLAGEVGATASPQLPARELAWDDWTLGELLGIAEDTGDRAWVGRLEELLATVHGETRASEREWTRAPGVLAGIEPGGPDVFHAMRGFRASPGIDAAQAGSFRSFYAWHPGQDIQAGLDPMGMVVAADGLRWHLRATDIHIDGAVEPLPTVAGRVDAHENLAYLETGRLRQYLANRADAPEHWMEIEGAGTVSGRVAVRFDQVGDFNLEVSAAGDEIRLLPAEMDEAQAGAALRYHRLQAWDAERREIPAFFEADGRGFSIVLHTAEAQFPLVIDPLIVRETGIPLDDLALTLATDIDLVAVGAPGFDFDASLMDRYQATWSLLEQEFIDVSVNLALNLFPKPDPIGLSVFAVDKLFNTFLGGPNLVERAERTAVLRNIGMVWVFARSTDRWVLVGILERIDDALEEARKYLDGDEASFDEWRFGEGLAVADGQLLVGEPGRAYWRVASVPGASILSAVVTGVGTVVPTYGVGEAIAWADGRPIHTSPRRKGRVYVFNHPEYQYPLQVIDGISTGGRMWGEVGAKIVAQDNRAVIFSSTSIDPSRGDIVNQDRTVTPSPKTSYWVSHHFERNENNQWIRLATGNSADYHFAGLSFIELLTESVNQLSILETAALDRHGDLWVGAQRPNRGFSTLYRVHRTTGQITELEQTEGAYRLAHWSGGKRTPRAHLVIARPDDADGRGTLQLLDTTSPDSANRPFLLDVQGQPGQRLGQSVALLDVSLLASDKAGRVHAWRDSKAGWRAMTPEEQGTLADLRDVGQLAAGRFWVAALTEKTGGQKNVEILTAEIPRSISGRLTFNGQPVAGIPVDAMEFIRLQGPGIPIDPFVYFCGTGCTVRDPREELHFNPNTGHFIEIANFDFRDYWGTLRNKRRIPLMGVEIEGAPEYTNLRFLGASMREWMDLREWRFHGNVRPLVPSATGGFRGMDYGRSAPASPSGWDELRTGIPSDGLGPMFPIMPSQDRLRLFMWDPLAPSKRETAASGVGSHFVARLAMAKDAPTRVVTDAEGRFEITGLRPSDAGLRIARGALDGSSSPPAGVYRLVSGGEDIDLYGNIAVSDVELVMDARGYGFSGRVEAGGAPSQQTFPFTPAESRWNANQPVTLNRQPGVSGISVRATHQSLNFSATVETDADGVYAFSEIPPGDYLVEFLNRPPGWGAAPPRTVSARYQGQSDQQEFIYRQRGGSTASSGFLHEPVPVDNPNFIEVHGALTGTRDAVVAQIQNGLRRTVNGERISYEFAQPISEVGYRTPGFPELKGIRPYFTGADVTLQGTRGIAGSAPVPGTRIRWSNSLGQNGVVVVENGQFQLGGLAPAIYQFELLGDANGYANAIISVDLVDEPSGTADFRFEGSGMIRFTGIDARVQAGQTIDDPLPFGNRVRIIPDRDNRGASSGALSISGHTLTPGQEVLSLPVEGLVFRQERIKASTGFTPADGGFGELLRRVSTSAGEPIFAVTQLTEQLPNTVIPQLVIRLGDMGFGGAARFRLIDPAGRAYPFEFSRYGEFNSMSGEELTFDFPEGVPEAGSWKIEVVEYLDHFGLIHITRADLRFVEVTEQAARMGNGTLQVSGTPAQSSVFEWVAPDGRVFPFTVPATTSAAERAVVCDWLPPLNGDWRLRAVRVAEGLEIRRAEVSFPNAQGAFVVNLDADGSGVAPSIPPGSYWIEMEPRLSGPAPAVFVAPRSVQVLANQTRDLEIRAEPLRIIAVEPVDGLGRVADASGIGGRLILESSRTPGLFWQLAPEENSGRRYTGLAPWWAHTADDPEVGRILQVGASPRWRQVEAAAGESIDRRSDPARIPLRVIEEAIRGVLTDRGAPLANIQVSLDSGQTTTTDEEGRFEFIQAPPGQRTLNFGLVGIPPVTVANDGLVELVSVGRPILPMRGRVVREDGVPVGDVLVKVDGSGESVERLTDRSGRFQFALPAGSYTVALEKSYYGVFSLPVVHEQGSGTELGDLTVARLRGDIVGTVTQDGVAMAGVEVQLRGAYHWGSLGEPSEPIARTTTTDASGGYRFDALPAGVYRITPASPGFAFLPAFQEYPVLVGESGPTAFEAFGGQIRGRILARNEAYGGFVMELRTLANQLLATAVSDNSGVFEFPTQPPGTYRVGPVTGAINREVRLVDGARTVSLVGNDAEELGDFAVELVGFSGQLIDELGDPVAHGTLRLDGPETLIIETDAEGQWQRTVFAGHYQFSAAADGVSFNNLNQADGPDRSLTSEQNHRIITGFRGGAVSGVVLRDGQPVPGQTVYLGQPFTFSPLAEGVTDADGRYHFSGLPRQLHTVHLRFAEGQEMNVVRDSSPGLPGGVGDVSTTRGVLELAPIELSPPATVSGIIEWDGQPMENALVTIRGGAQQYGNFRSFSALTAEDGRFAFQLLASDDYELAIEPQADSIGGDFSGVGLTDQKDLRFQLVANRSNTVRFFGVEKDNIHREFDFPSNFAPTPPLVRVNGKEIDAVVSDQSVSFTYSTPDQVRYAFEVEMPAGFRQVFPLPSRILSSDVQRLFDQAVRGDAVISGEITPSSGGALPHWIQIQLLDENGTLLAPAPFSANGEYRFTGLNPGRDYQIAVVDPSSDTTYLQFEVRTLDEPGVRETTVPGRILPLPQPFWLPFDAVNAGPSERIWKLAIPGDQVASHESYACTFWIKSGPLPWLRFSGDRSPRLTLRSADEQTHWEFNDGVFLDHLGNAYTPRNTMAFPAHRWQHLGVQVHAAINGIRRVVVYRFGAPVETFSIPEVEFAGAAELAVRLGQGVEFAGFQFISGLLTPDQWLDLPQTDTRLPSAAKVSLGPGTSHSALLEAPDGFQLTAQPQGFAGTLTPIRLGQRIRVVEGESAEVRRIWHDFWQPDQLRTTTIDSIGQDAGGFFTPEWRRLEPGLNEIESGVVGQIDLVVEPLIQRVELQRPPDDFWKSGESRKVRVWLNPIRKESHTLLVTTNNPMISGPVHIIEPGQDWIDLDVMTQPSAEVQHATIRVGGLLNGEPSESLDERMLDWPAVEVRTEPSLFPVTGRIVNEAGFGLEGIRVDGVFTDARGFFRIPPFSGSRVLRFGTVNFGGWRFAGEDMILVNGDFQRTVEVTDGPVNLGTIVASGDFKVRGRLLNLGPSGPVTVGLRGPGNLLVTQQTFTQSGFQTYEFTDLPPGDYVLFLEEAPFSNYQIRQFTLTEEDSSLDWLRYDFQVEVGVQSFTVTSNRGNFADSRGVYAGREFQLHLLEAEDEPHPEPGPHPDLLVAENFEERPTGILGAPWQVSAPSGLVFVNASGGHLIIEGGASNALAFLDLDGLQGQSGTTRWIRVAMHRVGPKDDPGRGPGGSPSWIRPVNFALFEGNTERLAIGEGTRNEGEDDDVWGLLIRGDVNDPGTVWTDATIAEPTQALVRIDYGAAGGQDRAWLWINPSWQIEPDTAQAAVETTGNFAFDRIRLFAGGAGSGGAGASGIFDDLGIATSWAGIQSLSGITPPANPRSADFAEVVEEAITQGRQMAIARTPSERLRVQAMLAGHEGFNDEQVVALGNYWLDLDEDTGVLVWRDGESVDPTPFVGDDALPARHVLGLSRPGFQLAAVDAPVFAGYVEERIPMTGRITAATVPQENLRITLTSSHPDLVRVPEALVIRGQASGGTENFVEFPIYINPTEEAETQVLIEARAGTNQVVFTQEVVVRRARMIHGRITDVTGRGLEGITVSDGYQLWPADVDGRFRVEAMDPAKTLTIRPITSMEGGTVSPAQYTRSFSLSIDADTDFVISGSESLRGRIDSLNRPSVESVALRIGELTVPSDPGGSFAIEGLLDHAYTLRPELAGYRFEPEEILVSSVDPAAQELVFEAIGLRQIAGSVMADGLSMPGAQIIVLAQDGTEVMATQSLTNGSFLLTGLSSAADYELLIRAPGYRDQRLTSTDLAAGPVSVSLSENRLSGTLLRADGGLFANASVTINGDTFTTAANGHFSFSRVPAGDLSVTIRAGSVFHETVVAMPAGGGVRENIEIRLPSRVFGTVTDDLGAPLAGIPVVITPEDAPELPPITYPIDLTRLSNDDSTINERFFQMERAGPVDDLELLFIFSGGGAERASLTLNTPRGSFDLVPRTSTARHPVDADGKVRLRFSTRSPAASDFAFKQWFDQHLKGHDLRGQWSVEINVTWRFVPPLNRFVDWTTQPVTLEAMEVNPLTPVEIVGTTVFTDAFGRYAMDTQVGTHTVEPAGHTDQLGFSPIRVVADTREGPVRTHFVRALHPAIQWTVPDIFVIDRDAFSLLTTGIASVPGTFTYTPNSLEDLRVGQNTLTLSFTPDSSDLPVRNLTRQIEVIRSPTPFELIMNARAAGLPEALQAPLADASGDGVPNLLAAFVGRDVLAGAGQPPVMDIARISSPSNGPVVVIHVPEGVEFMAAAQPYARWSGHRITIEASTDLEQFNHPAKWAPVPAGLPAPPSGYTRRAFTLDGNPSEKAFFRVRVEAEPD